MTLCCLSLLKSNRTFMNRTEFMINGIFAYATAGPPVQLKLLYLESHLWYVFSKPCSFHFSVLEVTPVYGKIKKKNLYFFLNIFNLLKYQNFIYYQIYMPIKTKMASRPLIDLCLLLRILRTRKASFIWFRKQGGAFDHHMFGFLFRRRIVKKCNTIVLFFLWVSLPPPLSK